MSARYLVLPVVALLGLAGCSGPDTALQPDEKPNGPAEAANGGPPIAPRPRAKEDGLPPPPALATSPRPPKPWAERIVGQWLHVNHRGWVGEKVWEFTREGKIRERYSYPAAPGRPTGIERSSWEYRVNGNILSFPLANHDDGTWVTEYTTFIETFVENELVLLSIQRKRKSLALAKFDAAQRKITLETALNEFTEEQGRTYLVRLKDK